MNQDIRNLILATNPWLLAPGELDKELSSRIPANFIPRLIPEDLKKEWANTARAHLIVGARQVGKSTLLWSYIKNLPSQNLLFVNCEELLFREWCTSPALFLKDVEELIDGPAIILLDEVQHLNDAALFIKGLIDARKQHHIFVTGSSSYHLLSRTRESLAGRISRMILYPFSWQELKQEFKNKPKTIQRTLDYEIASRLLCIGSYPEVWTSKDEVSIRLLQRLIESLVIRDVSDLFSIRRPDAFRKLLHLIAHQTGNLVNFSEWASLCGVSNDTIAQYVSILEESYIVSRMPVFAGGRRSEITSTPKIYFTDNGIRNVLLRNFNDYEERIDKGQMLENAVFSEIKKILPDGAALHFWRTKSKAEVDCIISYGTRLLAIDVKASAPRWNISKSARAFINHYAPEKYIILEYSPTAKMQKADTRNQPTHIGQTTLTWLSFPDLSAFIRSWLDEAD